MSYMGYNTSVSFSLATYFEAKERAFKKAKENKEGRRALLQKQRIKGEVA